VIGKQLWGDDEELFRPEQHKILVENSRSGSGEGVEFDQTVLSLAVVSGRQDIHILHEWVVNRLLEGQLLFLNE